jgi:hypothetical protein
MAIKLVFHANVPVYLGPFGSSNIFSVSSGVLPEVSGNRKKTWMNIATLKIPNVRYTFHFMFTTVGEVESPRARLNAQLLEVARATPFPLRRSGKS